MIWLYRYLKGWLRVRFYGDFPEIILNLCAVSGITLWNSKFDGDGITAYITVKDFKMLRDIIRGNKLRVHILNKFGFPFMISRYKKRPGLFIGIFLFFIMLEFLSGFIWTIEISGNQEVKREEIISACNKIGIHTGIRSESINPKKEREKLLLELDSLSWAALNIEGSRLNIEVSETEKKEEKENRPCNLKAEFDGIIKKIDITSGNSVVKVGDAVKKGDVLVSGIIENAGGTKFVCSSGDVIAEVKRDFSIEEKFEKIEMAEIGRSKEKLVLELFTLKIPLFLGAETKSYNEKTDVDDLYFLGARMPIRIYKKQFNYTDEIKIRRNENQLRLELKKQMEKILNDFKNDEYKIIKEEYIATKDGVKLDFTVCSEQNIAYCDFLLITTGNYSNFVLK